MCVVRGYTLKFPFEKGLSINSCAKRRKTKTSFTPCKVEKVTEYGMILALPKEKVNVFLSQFNKKENINSRIKF